MKKSQRSRFYVISLLAGTAAGTLLWEIAERLLSAAGYDIALAAGPVGFDISVIAAIPPEKQYLKNLTFQNCCANKCAFLPRLMKK